MKITAISNDFMGIDRVLADMGVPSYLKGWDCIARAVPMVCQRVSIVDTYEKVADNLGVTPASVERNIRTAAQISADRLGYEGCVEIYGNSLNPEKGFPTNAQLLVTAARRMVGMLGNTGSGNGL